jgi:hypothetical protein
VFAGIGLLLLSFHIPHVFGALQEAHVFELHINGGAAPLAAQELGPEHHQHLLVAVQRVGGGVRLGAPLVEDVGVDSDQTLAQSFVRF